MEVEDSEVFHTRIIETCLPLFKDGYFQHATLESMKQVEMAIREKGVVPKDRFGEKLVNWVLGNGEHITLKIPFSDDLQDKALALFKGSFGYYRNYAAHDGVKINKTICFRVMVLASELLDMLDASTRSFEGIGGIDGLIKSGIFKTANEFHDFLIFLDGQQIIEDDVTDYELELQAMGFNKIQEEAMFDFGFVSYKEWDCAPDFEMGVFDSTLVGEIALTHEGLKVLDELKMRLSSN